MAIVAAAAASYALDVVWIAALDRAGIPTGRVALLYGLVAAIASAGFALALVRGWNLARRDPHQSIPQLAVGYALQLGALYAAPKAGLLFLSTMFVVASFGALTLTVRQWLWSWLIVSALTGAVLATVGGELILPIRTPAQMTLVWLIFSSVLGRVALINVRVLQLRRLLARRNAELKATMARVTQEMADRQRAERALLDAQKLESVGRLAGGVAHDLNNMLQVVVGHTALLRARLQRPDDLSDLQQVADASDRAVRLTTELLTFARRRAGRPEALDLNDIVDAMSPMIGHLMGESVGVEVHRHHPLWRVWADRSQLELLLMNLCLNARDAMPHGGRLIIATEHLALDADEASRLADGVEAGEFVRLSVRDTGVGIPEQLLGQIFEPFFTTKEIGRGTGLGLASCYGVARQWGGHIGVESTVGDGATFELLLPRSTGAVKEAPVSFDDRALPTGDGQRILLVEDVPEARFVMRRMLEVAGYQVTEASNGEEALAELDVRGLMVDLVISDVVMPVMNGRALADHLTRTRPSLPVLLMSAYAPPLLVAKGLMTQGQSLLAKPVAADVLLRAVARALSRERVTR